MKQSDSQWVKTRKQRESTVENTEGLPVCSWRVSLVATAEAKGVSGLCPVSTAEAHTCDLNMSAKREGPTTAPDKFQASYHIKPNDSNSPMCFQIFPEGQEGQNTLLIFPDWAAQGKAVEHTSRETQHTHSQTFCGSPRVSCLCHQFCISNHCKLNQSNIC